MKILSGDLITWEYVTCEGQILPNEELWSTSMRKWVPIGIPSLVICSERDTYTWLSKNQLWTAFLDDDVTLIPQPSPNSSYDVRQRVKIKVCNGEHSR